MNKLQNLINHVALVIDDSGSMDGQPVVKVFDAELEKLKRSSVEMNQETRISIYLFGNAVRCLVFDMDVMRFKTLEGLYKPDGYTAMIDGIMQAVEDHGLLPQVYGDHAFLMYVMTDGGENNSRKHTAASLGAKLSNLPDNWTMACLVPNPQSVYTAKKYGFNKDSIAVWDPNSTTGVEDTGRTITTATTNFMHMRATGVRSSKGLFTMDSSAIKIPVKPSGNAAMKEVTPKEFTIYPCNRVVDIKKFVESWTSKPYRNGSTYYEPTKPVVIQAQKNILIQNRKNGRVYEGEHLRALLGLPDATVKVNPGQHKDWCIFVQSTSFNRKLYPDTRVLVRE